MISKIIFVFFFIIFLVSCSQKKDEVSLIKEVDQQAELIATYNEAMENLKKNDTYFAANKFLEAELLFPQSDWAPKSALMAAYSYYKLDYYGDAVAELKRFLRVYPNHRDIPYVYYLLGISYYEQIVDEKKDLQSIINAKETFKILIKKYPNTEYAIDAEFKINLIDDILASKEMYIGRYYFDKKKWIASINRFRTVIDEFDQTIYAEEALHRLVEIHYILGLNEEAKKYAKLLGYNYQSSKWYEMSYNVFNEKYKKISQENSKKNKKTNDIIKKIKSLLEWNGKKRN